MEHQQQADVSATGVFQQRIEIDDIIELADQQTGQDEPEATVPGDATGSALEVATPSGTPTPDPSPPHPAPGSGNEAEPADLPAAGGLSNAPQDDTAAAAPAGDAEQNVAIPDAALDGGSGVIRVLADEADGGGTSNLPAAGRQHSTAESTESIGRECALADAAEPEFTAWVEAECGLEIHPVCAMFPAMTPKELADLTSSIKADGLMQDIITYEGQILDGRHRLKVCRAVGLQPRFRDWKDHYSGPMSVSQWVWATNAERRSLHPDQILAIRLDVHEWEMRESARARQAEGRRRGGEIAGRGRPKPDSLPMKSTASYSGEHPADQDIDPPPTKEQRDHSGDVRAQLAADTGQSEYRVQEAMNLKKTDPEGYTAVKEGRTPLRQAVKRAKATTGSLKSGGPGKPISKRTQQQRRWGQRVANTANQRRATERAIRDAGKYIEALYVSLIESERPYFAEELIGFIRALQK